MLLTKMFTCTAARPTVAGRHEPRRSAAGRGRAGAHSGRKRQPRRRSDGHLDAGTGRGRRASVPSAQPSDHLLEAAGPAPTAPTAHAIATTLNRAGDEGGHRRSAPRRSACPWPPRRRRRAAGTASSPGSGGRSARPCRARRRSRGRGPRPGARRRRSPSDHQHARGGRPGGSGRGWRGGRPPARPSSCRTRA